MSTTYPIVPGHEIVGRVTKVDSAVTKFKPGDLAAVGCIVDSDGICPECRAGLENFCPNLTLTFGMPDKHLGGVTYGGYSESLVVDERFATNPTIGLLLGTENRIERFHPIGLAALSSENFGATRSPLPQQFRPRIE